MKIRHVVILYCFLFISCQKDDDKFYVSSDWQVKTYIELYNANGSLYDTFNDGFIISILPNGVFYIISEHPNLKGFCVIDLDTDMFIYSEEIYDSNNNFDFYDTQVFQITNISENEFKLERENTYTENNTIYDRKISWKFTRLY